MLDSSALLALLYDEPGAELVAGRIGEGVISAVNWVEVAQSLTMRVAWPSGVSGGPAPGPSTAAPMGSLLAGPGPLEPIRAVRVRLAAVGMAVAPLGLADADAAALMFVATRSSGLSLGDRCCLAFARRLGVRALTADPAWTDLPADLGVAVELIR